MQYCQFSYPIISALQMISFKWFSIFFCYIVLDVLIGCVQAIYWLIESISDRSMSSLYYINCGLTMTQYNRAAAQQRDFTAPTMIFYSLWIQYNLNPRGTRGVSSKRFGSCFGVRQSNRNVVTNARWPRDSRNVCGGLFRPSTIR